MLLMIPAHYSRLEEGHFSTCMIKREKVAHADAILKFHVDKHAASLHTMTQLLRPIFARRRRSFFYADFDCFIME